MIVDFSTQKKSVINKLKMESVSRSVVEKDILKTVDILKKRSALEENYASIYTTNEEEKTGATNVKNLQSTSISVKFVRQVSVESAQLEKHII